jgi:hypothetical protein
MIRIAPIIAYARRSCPRRGAAQKKLGQCEEGVEATPRHVAMFGRSDCNVVFNRRDCV